MVGLQGKNGHPGRQDREKVVFKRMTEMVESEETDKVAQM